MSCSEKKQGRNDHKVIVATIIFSSLIGTYLDLLFVSKQIYAFPARPFPQVFTINIAFTLFILPICTALFVWIMKMLPTLSKIIFIISIGLCMSISERFAEQLGWFVHSEAWHHSYSFFGYLIFLLFMWRFYRWFQ
ncbi:CBO0543 family protein [Bacillus sp. WLY-B-L8]|nr:CBO0543 family protein [Bacillus sp. WLY-B-L8]